MYKQYYTQQAFTNKNCFVLFSRNMEWTCTFDQAFRVNCFRLVLHFEARYQQLQFYHIALVDLVLSWTKKNLLILTRYSVFIPLLFCCKYVHKNIFACMLLPQYNKFSFALSSQLFSHVLRNVRGQVYCLQNGQKQSFVINIQLTSHSFQLTNNFCP